MLNRLFVGNLAFHVTEDLLKQRVSECGEVQSVDLILDRMTGRPRGFAFVEMSTSEGMQKALADLDGKDFEGRTLNVKVAEERRTGGGGAGGPRGGGGGGGPRGGGGGHRGGRDGGSGWGRGR
jgi:cold-inducible RNA-binding protein